MSNTLKKNAVMILAAALAAVMLFAVVFAPVSLADSAAADNGLAAAVEKTQATVSTKLGEIKANISEKVGGDVIKLESLWTYGDKVESGVETSTDDFVAAEIIGTPDGSIGKQLYYAKIYLDTDDLLCWTLIIVIISVAFEKLFMLLVRRLYARLERA